jgi:hypothetical protein
MHTGHTLVARKRVRCRLAQETAGVSRTAGEPLALATRPFSLPYLTLDFKTMPDEFSQDQE